MRNPERSTQSGPDAAPPRRYADIKAELVRRNLTLQQVVARTPWSHTYVARALSGGKVPEDVRRQCFEALDGLLADNPLNGGGA